MTSVLLASSLRFFLQIKAQSMTTPSHAAVILMLEAVWTALFAAWWFGETMTALKLLASLIFMALLINRCTGSAVRWQAARWQSFLPTMLSACCRSIAAVRLP